MEHSKTAAFPAHPLTDIESAATTPKTSILYPGDTSSRVVRGESLTRLASPGVSTLPIQATTATTAQSPNSTVPILPLPTNNDVAAARAQLPAHLASASDEQLRAMILHKREREYVEATQVQPDLTQQQNQQLQAHRMNIPRLQIRSTKPTVEKHRLQCNQNQNDQLQHKREKYAFN